MSSSDQQIYSTPSGKGLAVLLLGISEPAMAGTQEYIERPIDHYSRGHDGLSLVESHVQVTDSDPSLDGIGEDEPDVLQPIARLSDGWAGPGSLAPSSEVLYWASAVISGIYEFNGEPNRVVAGVDGSIAVYLWSDSVEKRLRLVCDPEGVIISVRRDSESDVLSVREICFVDLEEGLSSDIAWLFDDRAPAS